MTYDIFVSYRRSDRELVAAVVRRLEARGVGVWYDANIEGGADWRETVVEALTQSDMLAIFFSEDCNSSRQLKKELAIADKLGKPVVPILIENTQPRGAYLYELADRNWIQAWPDPADRIDELVEHLATLAGKSAGGMAGTAKSAADAAVKGPPASVLATGTDDRTEPEPDLAETAEDLLHAAAPTAAPPRGVDAYVGRASNPGKASRNLNDILPFKWIDLAILIPLLAAGAALFNVGDFGYLDAGDIAATVLLAITATAAYGALVFPVRYYLRRRPPLHALGSYLQSSALLYAVFAAGYLSLRFGANIFADEDAAEVLTIFAGVWGGFTLVAFLVYGILSGQRAIRSFRSNIRKL